MHEIPSGIGVKRFVQEPAAVRTTRINQVDEILISLARLLFSPIGVRGWFDGKFAAVTLGAGHGVFDWINKYGLHAGTKKFEINFRYFGSAGGI